MGPISTMTENREKKKRKFSSSLDSFSRHNAFVQKESPPSNKVITSSFNCAAFDGPLTVYDNLSFARISGVII